MNEAFARPAYQEQANLSKDHKGIRELIRKVHEEVLPRHGLTKGGGVLTMQAMINQFLHTGHKEVAELTQKSMDLSMVASTGMATGETVVLNAAVVSAANDADKPVTIEIRTAKGVNTTVAQLRPKTQEALCWDDRRAGRMKFFRKVKGGKIVWMPPAEAVCSADIVLFDTPEDSNCEILQWPPGFTLPDQRPSGTAVDDILSKPFFWEYMKWEHGRMRAEDRIPWDCLAFDDIVQAFHVLWTSPLARSCMDPKYISKVFVLDGKASLDHALRDPVLRDLAADEKMKPLLGAWFKL